MIRLYDYFRSTAAYRVRIVLNHKNIPHELEEVHLVNEGGMQHSDAYRAINPQGRVPTLVSDDRVITQSNAIIEYLEECYPTPAILPQQLLARAKVRAFAQTISCDIHPLNNLAVLQYLKNTLQSTDEQKQAWYEHWIISGFSALESSLVKTMGDFCFGDSITLADVCLIPQVYNALRFKVPLDEFPCINAIYGHCMQIDSFVKADPANNEKPISQ
jgi:maleylacetoacetate isomerase